ncbi:MAG TPA: beta-ketoacyl-[acyl-carrier-protein] synthase II, partial [Usitatibacter sp.]
ARRRGLTIGEAGGFALLGRDAGELQFMGYGETSDAYHMSTPHPEGQGARQSMLDALERAHVATSEIDYINLHGTATPANDLMEGRAVHSLFGTDTPCSSTKGVTGHTLGAAGITEAAIALLSLEHAFIPGSATTREVDPETQCSVMLECVPRKLERVMSNSFGFGGSNCSLVFAREG